MIIDWILIIGYWILLFYLILSDRRRNKKNE